MYIEPRLCYLILIQKVPRMGRSIVLIIAAALVSIVSLIRSQVTGQLECPIGGEHHILETHIRIVLNWMTASVKYWPCRELTRNKSTCTMLRFAMYVIKRAIRLAK